jgi:hypothetical protein
LAEQYSKPQSRPQSSEDLTLKYLKESYSGYKSHFDKNHKNRLIENYKLYKAYRNDKDYIWQTNMFVSVVFSMIETVLPRIVEYLWRGDRLVKAHPREQTDINQAKIVDDLLQYQIDTQIPNLFLEFIQFFKSTLIYGTGVSKLTWNVMENRPDFAALDIFDVVVPPNSKYVDRMDGIFQVYDKNLDSLMALQKQGIYKNIDKLIAQNLGVYDANTGKSEQAAAVGRDNKSKNCRPSALIKEYWGKVPVQDGVNVDAGYSYAKYEDRVVFIANDSVIIRELPKFPYGFKPFIVGLDYPDLMDFYAIGEVDNVKDLQYELNELENQALDNIKNVMNRMWKISSSAGVDLESLASYPNNVVIARDISGIQELDQKPLGSDFYQWKNDKMQDFQRISGISDYTRGMNMPGMTDTVGGISSLIEESNMRFSLKIKILQMTALKTFAEMLYKLDQQFITDIQLPVRVQGERGMGWMQINKDNLQGLYDFKPVSISMIGNRMARQNTLIRVLEVLAKAPPIPPVLDQILDEFEFTNKEEIMSYLYKLWGMNPDGSPMAPPMPPGMPGMPPGMPPIPEANTNAKAAQDLSKLMAVGMR